MKKAFLTVIQIIFVSLVIFPQTGPGKIITSAEADDLFGKPAVAVKLSTGLLNNFLASSSYLFFSFEDDRIIISNERKEILYPRGTSAKGNEIYHVFNSSVVAELLSRNPGEAVMIESRGSALTITNGGFTMEFGYLCPPYCDYE